MNAASKKILIADDDASIRLVLSQAFTRLGYQVRATGNAATLLKWCSDGEGDLVVTDVVMPDENVFDVLPRIRKERPKLPIIVMSAQNNLITAVNAADAGAFDYVPKPFDLDDMTSAARRALSRPADAEATRAQARAVRDDRLPLIGRSGPMQDVYRTVARLVGADRPHRESASGRACFYAYWEDPRHEWRTTAAQWREGGELGTAFPCDDGLTLVLLQPPVERRK